MKEINTVDWSFITSNDKKAYRTGWNFYNIYPTAMQTANGVVAAIIDPLLTNNIVMNMRIDGYFVAPDSKHPNILLTLYKAGDRDIRDKNIFVSWKLYTETNYYVKIHEIESSFPTIEEAAEYIYSCLK